MEKKTAPEANAEQKIQTRYDRKMEARRQKEEQDKKDEKRFRIISFIVIAALVLFIGGGIAVSVINKQTAMNGTYITIGEEEVTKLEYDYYYNNVVNNYMTTYSSLLPYMGIDPTQDFEEQSYTENLTWKDMFAQMTVEQMKQTFALLKDAETNGYSYDVTEDYNSSAESIQTAAKNAGAAISVYYESLYGDYATEKNIAPFIKQDILAAAYYNELLTTNAPSNEEIDAYYEEHKADYDKVDYRSFVFNADLEEETAEAGSTDVEATSDAAEETVETEAAEPTEEEIAAAMEEIKVKADAFMEDRKGGEDFEALCLTNASEEDKVNYEDTETEYSLSEGTYRAAIPTAITEWLYDDARAEGDITVIEDETYNRYYVVEFVQKYYDEADDANISSLIASEKVTEYIDTLIQDLDVTDVKGNLKYLTVSTETSKDAESSDSDAESEETATE